MHRLGLQLEHFLVRGVRRAGMYFAQTAYGVVLVPRRLERSLQVVAELRVDDTPPLRVLPEEIPAPWCPSRREGPYLAAWSGIRPIETPRRPDALPSRFLSRVSSQLARSIYLESTRERHDLWVPRSSASAIRRRRAHDSDPYRAPGVGASEPLGDLLDPTCVPVLQVRLSCHGSANTSASVHSPHVVDVAPRARLFGRHFHVSFVPFICAPEIIRIRSELSPHSPLATFSSSYWWKVGGILHVVGPIQLDRRHPVPVSILQVRFEFELRHWLTSHLSASFRLLLSLGAQRFGLIDYPHTWRPASTQAIKRALRDGVELALCRQVLDERVERVAPLSTARHLPRYLRLPCHLFLPVRAQCFGRSQSSPSATVRSTSHTSPNAWSKLIPFCADVELHS